MEIKGKKSYKFKNFYERRKAFPHYCKTNTVTYSLYTPILCSFCNFFWGGGGPQILENIFFIHGTL